MGLDAQKAARPLLLGVMHYWYEIVWNSYTQ